MIEIPDRWKEQEKKLPKDKMIAFGRVVKRTTRYNKQWKNDEMDAFKKGQIGENPAMYFHEGQG